MRGIQNDNTKNELSSIIKQKNKKKTNNYYKKGATLLYPYLENTLITYHQITRDIYWVNLLRSIGLEPK